MFLPTPTLFLTSLIKTLSSLSHEQEHQHDHPHQPHPHSHQPNLEPPPLPAAARPLLTTLHVLFPHALLDALDLLDRGLVTRVDVCEGVGAGNGDGDAGDVAVPGRRERESGLMGEEEQEYSGSVGRRIEGHALEHRPAKRTYYVRSAQIQPHTRPHTQAAGSAAPRRHDRRQPSSTAHHTLDTLDPDADETGTAAFTSHSTVATPSYQVQLQPWHCSCPAFAFSCFSGEGEGGGGGAGEGEEEQGDGTEDAFTDLGAGTGAGATGDPRGRGDQQSLGLDTAAPDPNSNPDPETRAIRALWHTRVFSPATGSSSAGTRRDEHTPTELRQADGQAPSWSIFRFGGLALPNSGYTPSSTQAQAPPPPSVCKHLLACVLAEQCPGFFGAAHAVGEAMCAEARSGAVEDGDRYGSGGEARGEVRGVVCRVVGKEGVAGFAAGEW